MVKTLFGILLSAMFLFAMGPGDGRQVLGCQEGDVIEIPEVGGLHHRYERRAA